MAVVATYTYPCGTVSVHDDCFAGVSREELKRREERMWRVAEEIMARAEMREREKDKK